MLNADMFKAAVSGNPRVHPRLASHWRFLFKRTVDLIIALPLALALLPLMLVIAVAIRLESNGPALFLQTRYGRGLKPFSIFKFRTLRWNMPDPTEKYEMLSADPRITRLGGILRRTSLDELPQLWNVIRGDMSLIGPRPLVEWESEQCLHRHAERFFCLPGITGLSQVTIRNGGDLDDRSDWDIEYTRTWSLLLDLEIFLRTPVVAVRGMEVYVASNAPQEGEYPVMVAPKPPFAVLERKALASVGHVPSSEPGTEKTYAV